MTLSGRSVTLLEMPPGFPELVLLDESGIIDVDYVNNVLGKLQIEAGETTYTGVKRVERYKNIYVILGSYGSINTDRIRTVVLNYLEPLGATLTSQKISDFHLIQLENRLPKRNSAGEWHGGTTPDSLEIDEGIKPIVLVLNNFGVTTFSSCEGHNKRTPYVLFKSDFATLERLGATIYSVMSSLSEEEVRQLGLRLLWNHGEWIQHTGIYFELRFEVTCPMPLIEKFSGILNEKSRP